MTMSISGRCGRTGLLGIAIASSSLSVAARCAYARAGVGVCATQNITDPRLGPRGLALMESGYAAEAALQALRDGADHPEYRQLGLLDNSGNTACYSGANSLGIHGSARGRNALALGNLLANDRVPDEMVRAFESQPDEHLGDRLIAAMQAGLAAGGEAGPVFSSGMILVDRVPWPVADLRIDNHADPIGELVGLWKLWYPQMDDYVTRALNPRLAPKYGVPGDL